MWYKTSLSKTGTVIPMPVPSSYNDITQDKELRDFVGWVWYDREFYVDSNWKNDKIVHLRIESAHYNAIVWINSHFAFNHSGGHLPFEGEVSHLLNYFTINRITIAVNNTLTPTTLPPGSIKYERNSKRYPRGYFVQNLQMDFFNYAGIHRHVWLYTTPQIYIHDIILKTSTTGSTGLVTYLVVPSEAGNTIYCDIQVLDKDGKTVVRATGISGTIMIPNANLWWPYTMNKTSPAYLYTFRVVLLADKIDVYRQPFGIRTVAVTDDQLLINKKPFYCLGVGRHEDADVRGKGLDLPLIAKDFNLMKWLGVNCFRTSHYPYSEDLMDQADQQGFAVIDESPGVGIEGNNMGSASLAHHQEVMREMIHRDKNRPSVIIWSVANEPQSYRPEAEHYFGAVVNFTRQLDATRPVTFVMNADFTNDRAAKFVDILCINRYYGWYSDNGHTEVIPLQLAYDLDSIYNLHHRPIILAEYGADAIAGLHRDPSVSFSEEYQVDLLAANHKVFNKLRHKYLVGEMVWNFADFQTAQNVKRVAGNKKGILTRQRQPKLAAFLIRSRYMAINNGTLNEDVCGRSITL
ncbi:uidA [Acanthosepion pharaonis]|uniref:Beta-glucuronidase n=1 Tax=Acanthosepion pharaonis TaxID=158019 RepID=A0A812E0D2_ACAPH|nr:uidA [Sepia pharaonis]